MIQNHIVIIFAELPDKRPQLYTEHTRYEPGDILRANCSTPPSRPRAELKFTINNMVVSKRHIKITYSMFKCCGSIIKQWWV